MSTFTQNSDDSYPESVFLHSFPEFDSLWCPIYTESKWSYISNLLFPSEDEIPELVHPSDDEELNISVGQVMPTIISQFDIVGER